MQTQMQSQSNNIKSEAVVLKPNLNLPDFEELRGQLPKRVPYQENKYGPAIRHKTSVNSLNKTGNAKQTFEGEQLT